MTWVTTAPHRNSASRVTTSPGTQAAGTEQVGQHRDQRADRERRRTTRPRRPSARPGRRGRRRAPRGRARRPRCRRRRGSAGRPRPRAPGRCPSRRTSRPARRPRPCGLAMISRRSLSISRCGGLGLAGHRGVLPRRHRERAGGEAGQPGEHDRGESVWSRVPPATPAISAKLETSPSIAPNTAGRSQPPVTSGCSCEISGTSEGTRVRGHAVNVASPGRHFTEGKAHLIALRRWTRLRYRTGLADPWVTSVSVAGAPSSGTSWRRPAAAACRRGTPTPRGPGGDGRRRRSTPRRRRNSTIEVHTLSRSPKTSLASTASMRRYSIQPRPAV